ncbi:MAG: O-antigen ligase family protein [Balneolaceae bacterium]|nr:O-antigen ligase family protein [Balneolaceae bacterium]MCH8549387.1 O-antigen ligase family protein [Balneolaceae bacterium]
MSRNTEHIVRALLFLSPFFLYENLTVAIALSAIGLGVIFIEKISDQLARLEWREFVFFTYLFHMLYGERAFAYTGLEPLFVTEMVIGALSLWYARDLLQVRRILAIYYLIVLIGLFFALSYIIYYRIDAIRDSLMLVYALWVPIVYHIFKRERHYDLFFALLKIFIVLKAVHYVYEFTLILLGIRTVLFEGFRFGVGYILPALIVISIFTPLRQMGWPYKLLSLMMFPAVFTMFHRSMFLGIALAALFIFFLGGRKIKINLFTYSAAGLALMVAFLAYYTVHLDFDILRFLDRKTSMEEGNINYRLISWELVMDKFREYWILGFGVGRPIMYVHSNIFYEVVNLSYFEIRRLGGNAQPHNSYLNILARFGIFIFPLFLWAVLKPFFRFAKIWRIGSRYRYEAYSRFLLLAGLLLFMYVWAFFNVVLESPHHSFPFWLAIGMLLSYERTEALKSKVVRGIPVR